jgi:hypothetical protein
VLPASPAPSSKDKEFAAMLQDAHATEIVRKALIDKPRYS